MDINKEFDRQVNILINKGYPNLAKISEVDFKNELEKLKEKLPQNIESEVNLELGKLPFVIVTKNNFISSSQTMSLVEKDGKKGIIKLFPHDTNDFMTIPEVKIPDSDFYLLINIDRGKDNINLPPNEAFKLIKEANRSPLTIEEGISIVTLYPEYLIKNNCFSLLASRHQGDQRVPAIWINSLKQPNLGWCWDGNPHTWLGSASCAYRIASE